MRFNRTLTFAGPALTVTAVAVGPAIAVPSGTAAHDKAAQAPHTPLLEGFLYEQ